MKMITPVTKKCQIVIVFIVEWGFRPFAAQTKRNQKILAVQKIKVFSTENNFVFVSYQFHFISFF